MVYCRAASWCIWYLIHDPLLGLNDTHVISREGLKYLKYFKVLNFTIIHPYDM